MTPPLLGNGRRGLFLRLLVLTACESGALAAAAALAKYSVASTAMAAVNLTGVAALVAASVTAGALQWMRAVTAERFGGLYSNDLRVNLARHAATVSGRGGTRRLGLLATRMAGDLVALKNWAADGISLAASATAAGLAAFFAMVMSAGTGGALVWGMVAGLQLAVMLMLWRPLDRAWADLRRQRGRVASLAADVAMAGAAIYRFDAMDRETSRMRSRNSRLLDAGLSRSRAAEAVAAWAVLSMAGCVAGAALLGPLGLGGPSGLEAWTLFLFGAGLLSSACTALARATDLFLGFRVADRRMRALAAGLSTSPPPEAETGRAKGGPFAEVDFGYSHLEPVAKGSVVIVTRGDPSVSSAIVSRAASESSRTRFRSQLLRDLPGRALARDVAIVSPEIPLIRGSVRRNLTIRRKSASDDLLRKALDGVGLSSAAADLERMLDPEIGMPDSWTQARLRLARAVTHGADVIFIAEPTLIYHPSTPDMLEAVRELCGAAIVCAYESAFLPRPGWRTNH